VRRRRTSGRGEHQRVSFWLPDSGDDLTSRPPLDGDTEVDVVVVGAGFTGLWTARELVRRDPSRSVLVVEAEIAGFGASGRNGAWLTAGLGVTPRELARRTSPSTVREVTEAMRATVDEVLRACDEDAIDVRARRGGLLRIARGVHEQPALRSGHRAMVELGIDAGIELLDADALARRVRVADARGALFDPHAAAVHPGRLVRGLARTVERHGVRIVESTRVRRVLPREVDAPANARGRRPRVVTARGTVTAEAVVLATEAWTSQLPGRRRSVLPLYSLIVLTEPVDAARWARIGWHEHELLSSHRLTVDYLSRTPDGRVLFGGRGAPYHLGSRISPAFDRHDATHELLRRQLTAWFPPLTGVAFTHAWGGPVGMPRDWLPGFGFDPITGVGGGYGYTGQGVGTSNLAGRVIADLIVHGDTPYASLPMVGHRSRRWEPEPLRWLGARYLQGATARLDARAARSGRAVRRHGLAQRLLRH
jgi:glycine/D-amino acid oxidase-like deaminating enzyme